MRKGHSQHLGAVHDASTAQSDYSFKVPAIFVPKLLDKAFESDDVRIRPDSGHCPPPPTLF